MRGSRELLLAPALLLCALGHSTAAAQETPQPVLCRDLPCAVLVDWTRAGGVTSQTPDRRYGNAAQLDALLKSRLTDRGFRNINSSSDSDPHIILVPMVRNAMCDEMPGTSTDMSCRAIAEIEVRVQGPAGLTKGVDLPSRLRNRCTTDQVMPVDKLATFVSDWIVYAVEGKAKGERRPVGRC